ncbi:hypothetical protein VC83_09265 [Pseudogymnoascus destructans]|uniref:Uncharacterized protein n=2 Tax=Pseudogymnoascus destructans TaxID=655981 RepID=L8FX50_PSED2|nr:uncharacterized protein VC83_09265 [Pseudogymnoascus destructans]ELR05545.1 hypothetical protein GMDG_07465 [Pseudogymnoascus destructans 20631-21]OAF54513.1 hypothetical protein VC83_09265 [Pseudogymnoascus destructans]
MDSMRSLNTSLPRASPPKQQTPNPPEQLLQAFKDAALSVTKLYKTAASDQTKLRAEGYQDALDDLLTYLDKEDIGLSDGEGWKVRQWATARLDGRDPIPDSDDEMDKERGSSPVAQKKPNVTSMPIRNSSPVRLESVPPILEVPEPVEELPSPPTITVLPPTGNFSFRSTHQYPQDADMSDQGNQTAADGTVISAAPTSITISRSNRSGSRQVGRGRHSTRNNTRSHGSGSTGQKRKINFGDFFDIGDLSKDGFGGGGKRSRLA